MQLDWTTFVLEIVNFLILLWILKRFLYQPVLQAIAQRKASIEQTLVAAKKQQTDAQALEEHYRTRLDAWEQEKAQLRDQMLVELHGERERQLGELQNTLAQEREKSRVLDERRLRDLERKYNDDAQDHAAKFAARLLERLATPTLEVRLVDVAIEDLAHLPDRQRQALHSAFSANDFKLKVVSAFPMPEAQRVNFERVLTDIAGKVVQPTYVLDTTLLAGVRASAGPWILHANLLDELKYFAEATRHGDAG